MVDVGVGVDKFDVSDVDDSLVDVNCCCLCCRKLSMLPDSDTDTDTDTAADTDFTAAAAVLLASAATCCDAFAVVESEAFGSMVTLTQWIH